MRRTITMAGLLMLALLPVAAVVSAAAASPTPIPVAVAEPLASVHATAVVTLPAMKLPHATLPEPELLIVIGCSLFGLAAIVRRAGG